MSLDRVLGAGRTWRAGQSPGSSAARPSTCRRSRQKVTEHQLIERECRCGHRIRGAAPAGAEASVQYGPRVAAVIIYLCIG
jgi:hypothetical protein